MKNLRWQILIIVLALASIAILLLGRQPVIQTAEPEPVTGGVYTEGLIGSFGRLNPVLDYHNPADREVNRLLFSSMVRHDSRGLPQPEIAESWGISKDGTIYNFSLRTDAIWHDGAPVTSDDVIFTVDMLRDEDSLIPADLREFWSEIEIRRLDDQTMQFILPEPFSPFLDYLTFGILPAHLLGDMTYTELVDSEINLEPIGSGPYRFDQILTENGEITGVILSAFDDYFLGRPFIDQIVLRYYPDAAAAFRAYREGEILGIGNVAPDILGNTLEDPDLNVFSGRLPQVMMIYFNLDDPSVAFFQDAAVRQALLLGLNRQRMIDRLMRGQAIIADGPIFPGNWAYFDGLETVAYDPEQAIALLKNAGFTITITGGNIRQNEEGPLAFELLHPDDEFHSRLAETIQGYWEAIGVQVELVALPIGVMIRDHLEPREYQAALIELDMAGSPDPDPYPFWHQTQATGGQNYARWDDRPASELLEQARVTVDIEERARLYRNFQVRFARELPALPLFYPVYTYAVDNQVQGVNIGPLFDTSDRFELITDWFLLARRSVDEALDPTATP